jgi:hypothetical protein
MSPGNIVFKITGIQSRRAMLGFRSHTRNIVLKIHTYSLCVRADADWCWLLHLLSDSTSKSSVFVWIPACVYTVYVYSVHANHVHINTATSLHIIVYVWFTLILRKCRTGGEVTSIWVRYLCARNRACNILHTFYRCLCGCVCVIPNVFVWMFVCHTTSDNPYTFRHISASGAITKSKHFSHSSTLRFTYRDPAYRQAGRQAWLVLLHFNNVRHPRWHPAYIHTCTHAHTHTQVLHLPNRQLW